MYSEADREKFRKASEAKDWFFVAVKVLLRDGDKLLITHDIFDAWDIPGGRIRSDQFDEPLESILDGKIRVELGSDVKYELGNIKTTFRVDRNTEVGHNGKPVHIFGVAYEATYLGGEVTLGEYHDKYEWIDLKTADLSKYASHGGWVEKLADYQKTVAR